MNRKITDFALARKCGGLAAIGFTRCAAARAAEVEQGRQRDGSEAMRGTHQNIAARYRCQCGSHALGNIDKLVSI